MLGRAALKRILSGLAPGGVYLDRHCHQRRGELLPHLFTLTAGRNRRRLFSVALSRGSPRVAI